jgi:hypothetical protein
MIKPTNDWEYQIYILITATYKWVDGGWLAVWRLPHEQRRMMQVGEIDSWWG